MHPPSPSRAEPVRHRRSAESPLALHLIAALGMLIGLVGVSRGEPLAAGVARLADERLPAAGQQRTVLSVPVFGRYAVVAQSDQGVSVQLVDRMAGPGPVDGEAGKRDGRVDELLERGEVLVVTHGDEDASGEVQLSVHHFAELQPSPPPLLQDGREISTELGDFEQRSWAIVIEQRRRVVLEAAGRSLSDLRLWQGGGWLVDAAPLLSAIEPRVGEPLGLCQLTAVLDPGVYLLVAYGGPPRPWAEDDGASPLHVRMGVPSAAIARRSRLTVGPFGYERFAVPGEASFFRVELPEAVDASLELVDYDPESPFAGADWVETIDKRSLPPVAELSVHADEQVTRLLTVRASAGQPLVLQHFEARREYHFRSDGEHWISTIHSGHPADSVDATGLLVRRSGRPQRRPEAAQAIPLGEGRSWARRCNLLEPLTIFVEILETGDYELLSRGVPARMRIEPFLERPPRDYEPPPFRTGDSVWSLDVGIHVLTVEPEQQGILDVGARRRGAFAPLLDRLGLGEAPEESPVWGSVRLGEVRLSLSSGYVLYLNQQPGVAAGVVLRESPVDVRSPLPLTQSPEEVVEVAIRVVESGVLRAVREDGGPALVSIDDGPWASEVRPERGVHRARVRVAGSDTVVYSLELEPDSLARSTPLPAIDPRRLGEIPSFPALAESSPRAFDLDTADAATFVVRAERPALYRVESTGLLATEGNLRTRVNPSLARDRGAGTGRNFLIQRYLREGDYQLTAATLGRSRGHLAVRLSETPLIDGGKVALGVAARRRLEAGEAIAYHFEAPARGRYRGRALGLGRQPEIRLEDADGWPVGRDVWPGSFELELEAGGYRLIVLPNPLPARQVTLVEAVPEAPERRGHGPFELPLATSIAHVWMEPEGDDPRHPDRWVVRLPAAATVTARLSDGMSGTLVDATSGAEVAVLAPQRGWRGELPRGDYELQVCSSRPDNRRSYSLSLWADELLAGGRRSVVAPAEVQVSIGEPGVYELASFGPADVRARLVGSEGHVVASSDDRPGDWGFLMVNALAPGRYQLLVSPVGAATGSLEVGLLGLAEGTAEPLEVPGRRRLAPGAGVVTVPLGLPPQEGLVVATASSPEVVGLALDAEIGGRWVGLDSRVGEAVWVGVPVSGTPDRLRLRVWTPDRRGNAVELAVGVGRRRVSEQDARRGVELEAVDGSSPTLAAWRLDLDGGGCLQVAGPIGVRSSAAPLIPLADAGEVVSTAGRHLWLAADLASSGRRFRTERLRLDAVRGTPLSLGLTADPVQCDLGTSSGPTVVRAFSVVGQPGVAISRRGEVPERRDRMAVGGGEAVAVALQVDDHALSVWAADPEAREARVEAWSFPDRALLAMAGGVLEGALSGTSWQPWTLPPGHKRVQLALEPGLVATLSLGTELRSVHWSGSSPRQESVDTEADRLSLFRLGEGDGRYRVEVGAPYDRPAPWDGGLLARVQPASGTWRLPLPAGREGEVRVIGARGTLVAGDGTVRRGATLALPAGGGWLEVEHDPGPVLLWVQSREGEGDLGPLGPTEASPAAVVLPAELALSGSQVAYEAPVGEESLLSFRAVEAIAWRLVAGARRASAVELTRPSFDVVVPAGRLRLDLRGLLGPLSGGAQLRIAPLLDLGEGLGPEVLLGPGEARAFRFLVERQGPVGIGVRATAEGSVEAHLVGPDGAVVARGLLQMPVLSPGDYALVVRAADDSRPVRIRAALAGVEPPGHGPPAEVIARYLALARGEPAEAPDRLGDDEGWADEGAANDDDWAGRGE